MNREATVRDALPTETITHYTATFPARAPRSESPPLLTRYTPLLLVQWRGKRVFDVVGALVLVLVFSPVILAIVAWLWINRGPILFRHERIGRGGQMFTCYKFATMVRNADQVLFELLRRRPDLRAEWIRDQKLREDPRVTRFGAFLRRTSLDELPQLWNVLKGEMSLVGPRPIVQQEIARYNGAIRHYLAMKPGITGLWQVSGRNNLAYRRRVALDRAYAMRASLGLDLRILFRTVGVVLFQRGAY